MNLQVEPALAKPTLVRYKVLAWVCALSMITYIDRVCIKSLEGEMTRDLGLTSQQFAWVFAAFGLAYALFEMPSNRTAAPTDDDAPRDPGGRPDPAHVPSEPRTDHRPAQGRGPRRLMASTSSLSPCLSTTVVPCWSTR